MSQKTLFTKSALAVAVALISTQAWSAGFQLNEFSSSGLGRAYSGEGAIADDAGNVSRNPALITMFDRPTFSAGAVYIDPDVNISGTSPSGRSLKADNIAPTAWVPNMHFVAPINDQFGWGASITSNYGLATEFNDTYVLLRSDGSDPIIGSSPFYIPDNINFKLQSKYKKNGAKSTSYQYEVNLLSGNEIKDRICYNDAKEVKEYIVEGHQTFTPTNNAVSCRFEAQWGLLGTNANLIYVYIDYE